MWHALRAELVYSRPYLLGGWGIAVGVMAIISVVFFAVGDDGIAQALRSEERRARLLLVGSLTPRQLAGAMVLLPAIMFGLGIVAAGLVMGAGALATGSFEPKSLNIATSVGGYLLVYAQIALLLQEANAARRQARQRAAVAGWAGVVIAALFLAVLYLAQARGLLTSAHLMVGHLLVVVAAMAATVQLYSGRRDFTR
jgi:hypothetical protein